MLDPNAVDDLLAFGAQAIRLTGLGRNIVAELFVFLKRDAIADLANLGGHAFERKQRCVERRGTEKMIGVIVRNVEPGQRLSQTNHVAVDLAREWQGVLRVDDE